MYNQAQIIALAAYYKRLQGFYKDGYSMMFQSILNNDIFAKLHHTNGSRLFIEYHLDTKCFRVNRNGKNILDETLR